MVPGILVFNHCSRLVLGTENTICKRFLEETGGKRGEWECQGEEYVPDPLAQLNLPST
jgi:hypothetical protein